MGSDGMGNDGGGGMSGFIGTPSGMGVWVAWAVWGDMACERVAGYQTPGLGRSASCSS